MAVTHDVVEVYHGQQRVDYDDLLMARRVAGVFQGGRSLRAAEIWRNTTDSKVKMWLQGGHSLRAAEVKHVASPKPVP
jgi:hypothetical protein